MLNLTNVKIIETEFFLFKSTLIELYKVYKRFNENKMIKYLIWKNSKSCNNTNIIRFHLIKSFVSWIVLNSVDGGQSIVSSRIMGFYRGENKRILYPQGVYRRK